MDQNPHRPYTQQNADWERRQREQREAEDRRYRDNMRAVERQNAERVEPMHRTKYLRSVPKGTLRAQAPSGRASGMAVLGGIIGLLLAAGAGSSVLGGIILGAIAGALLTPVLRLLGWLTLTAIKLAVWIGIILLAIAALGALYG